MCSVGSEIHPGPPSWSRSLLYAMLLDDARVARGTPLSGQHGLNGADDLGRVRFCPRPKPLDHLTVGRDQKLLEVPLNVARLTIGIDRLGQLGIQRVAVVAVYVGLLQQRERHPVGG